MRSLLPGAKLGKNLYGGLCSTWIFSMHSCACRAAIPFLNTEKKFDRELANE
jgi:hypothetical protein